MYVVLSFWIRCFRAALTFVFIFFVRAMSVGPVQTLVMHWNMFMQSSWAWFVGGRLGLRRELGV